MAWLCLATMLGSLPAAAGADGPQRPNLVFILADDLGYGEVGCYGQQKIRTPRLDRIASEGVKFTDFYAGSTVCAPSRSVLMTGLHTGHTGIRGNRYGDTPLGPQDVTVAGLLQQAGYATAVIGKWGLGRVGTSGHPNRQGFDYFFGYENHWHAHNYYPSYLFRNDQRVALRNVVPNESDLGAGVAQQRVDYGPDLMHEEALRFIRENRDQPFFLYYAHLIPHANNEKRGQDGDGTEVPDLGVYAEQDWTPQDQGHAAMITYLDRQVGEVLDLLQELGLAENTLVLVTSDNGPHRESGQDPELFRSSGPLRGMKRDLYEGGIRVPTLACWPGRIEPGTVSGHVGYFGDLMATAAELAGVGPPTPNDSISLLPTLLGQHQRQKGHDFLYWEFYERGGARAVRQGQWKAVRPQWHAPLELYDLDQDLGERNNLAQQHPQQARKMAEIMERAHQPDSRWKPPAKQ